MDPGATQAPKGAPWAVWSKLDVPGSSAPQPKLMGPRMDVAGALGFWGGVCTSPGPTGHCPGSPIRPLNLCSVHHPAAGRDLTTAQRDAHCLKLCVHTVCVCVHSKCLWVCVHVWGYMSVCAHACTVGTCPCVHACMGYMCMCVCYIWGYMSVYVHV